MGGFYNMEAGTTIPSFLPQKRTGRKQQEISRSF
jgi:hypothetical protein